MPRRDGTGPLGQGAMSGRGLGLCSNINAGTFNGRGRGLGCGRGFNAGAGFGAGRGNRRFSQTTVDRKLLLNEEKNLLQARLDRVKQELGDI